MRLVVTLSRRASTGVTFEVRLQADGRFGEPSVVAEGVYESVTRRGLTVDIERLFG